MTFSPQKGLQFRTEKSVGFAPRCHKGFQHNFPSKRTISEGACTLLYLTMFHHLQPASPKAAPLLAPSPQRVPPLHPCRCCCHLLWKKDICLPRNWGQLLRCPIFVCFTFRLRKIPCSHPLRQRQSPATLPTVPLKHPMASVVLIHDASSDSSNNSKCRDRRARPKPPRLLHAAKAP